MVPFLANLGEHVVELDEDVGIGDLGVDVVLLTGQDEAGQQFEEDVVMPRQAGSGQHDLEMGAPLCPLLGFLARIMAPIEVSVLGTPATMLVPRKEVEAPSVRRSGRIAKLHPEGANMEQLAMEAVARRLGSRPEEANPSEHLRQEYFALWDGPLTDQAAAAIDDLVLSVKKPKKKKTPRTEIERQVPPEMA